MATDDAERRAQDTIARVRQVLLVTTPSRVRVQA
jgi:hypothetical protein